MVHSNIFLGSKLLICREPKPDRLSIVSLSIKSSVVSVCATAVVSTLCPFASLPGSLLTVHLFSSLPGFSLLLMFVFAHVDREHGKIF